MGVISFFLFLLFGAQGIFGGDSGDLVSAAATLGVPHPPGYPLYTLLGWMASRLPFFTPAWRVGLLSSIPHAVVIFLVYWCVSQLTKNRWAALYGSVVLLGNYLFFLYSVTPEVFALFDLFVLGLVSIAIAWQKSKNSRWLYVGAFVLGLSLAHHHVILFLVPALGYMLWRIKVNLLSLCLWFFMGCIPYLYILVAARGNSMINWDRAVDVHGFVRLITRADYGTFVSGGLFGSLLTQRFIQLQAYGQFLFLDFSWIGLVLICCGFWFLWKIHRHLCVFFGLALLFLGPVFFFYASFPLANRFTIGTYERFLLPSYVLYALIIGCGLYEIGRCVKRIMPLALVGGYLILSLFPLLVLGTTVWRFYGLSTDRTADNLGRDILAPLPAGSILFLGRDTTLFTTQYIRYALGVRPDIIVLHTSRLSSRDYQIIVNRIFPSLSFTAKTGDVTSELVQSQYGKRRIFSNTPLSVGPGWYWVPYGLTFELLDEKKLPNISDLIADNRAIWENLHDPTVGILSRYNHLMLADVRDVYAGARISLGATLLRAGKLVEAQEQFQAAIRLAGDVEMASAYTYLGVTELLQNHCDVALSAFAKAKSAHMANHKELTLYEGVTYRDCAKDEKRAKELLDQFEQLKQKEEIPLHRE